MKPAGKLSLLLAACVLPLAGRAATLQVCGDQAEMPPFTYAQRGAVQPPPVTGASLDLLRAIGKRNGWEVEAQLMPWARCLAMVADGRMAVALNAGQLDNRGLLLSRPYFSMHNQYYTSRRARPQGITLGKLSDMRAYHICGLGGYRFEAYGVDTASVDRGTTSYEQLIAKLHLGRCDLFIDSRETMAGQYLVNPRLRALIVDGTLVSKPLPDVPLRPLHFGVAANRPDSKTLLNSINQGLAELEKSHEMARLLDRYLE